MRVIARPIAGTDVDFGASPILVDLDGGRQLLLDGQKSSVVWAFDPARKGKVVWQTRIGKGGPDGGIQWGIAYSPIERLVFAPISDCVRTSPPAVAGYLRWRRRPEKWCGILLRRSLRVNRNRDVLVRRNHPPPFFPEWFFRRPWTDICARST